ncbi:hypothetical protein [Sphingobacterium bovistauri]|uniref:Type IV pili methyl-accepting chemotaxis transducer N-term n=1 Tax=Sphingobacterium bovistauri TaxID=2781959 RepID=A0ABS7Z581_9SPHI|nr:hypothetical protein [Sphingobacterium bovistauri]MCA5004045.1 hypothetical protein [Sphingobacterium bovistauri]
MKKIAIIIMALSINFAKAQIYIDPTVAAATATHAGVINNQLNDVNRNLTLIQRGQLAITGQLTIANDLQNQIYRGLTEVAAVMRSLVAVKDISEVSTDIVENINKALVIAKTNPILLLFAEESAREFKSRATNLALEVGTFVLKGGKDNLLDSGERAKILNHIRIELNILRGIAFGMQRSMFWAQQRGILQSLNPYSKFINIDKSIADDIIRNSRLVKK